MMTTRMLVLLVLAIPTVLSAQSPDNRVFYYPKPIARSEWRAPMKPVTRLADVKAKHQSAASCPAR